MGHETSRAWTPKESLNEIQGLCLSISVPEVFSALGVGGWVGDTLVFTWSPKDSTTPKQVKNNFCKKGDLTGQRFS